MQHAPFDHLIIDPATIHVLDTGITMNAHMHDVLLRIIIVRTRDAHNPTATHYLDIEQPIIYTTPEWSNHTYQRIVPDPPISPKSRTILKHYIPTNPCTIPQDNIRKDIHTALCTYLLDTNDLHVQQHQGIPALYNYIHDSTSIIWNQRDQILRTILKSFRQIFNTCPQINPTNEYIELSPFGDRWDDITSLQTWKNIHAIAYDRCEECFTSNSSIKNYTQYITLPLPSTLSRHQQLQQIRQFYNETLPSYITQLRALDCPTLPYNTQVTP